MAKSEQTKRDLIRTTQELLKEGNLFTIKDIAQRAYVNIAAVNYHFGDKEHLISEAIHEILTELKTELKEKALCSEPHTTEETLAGFVDLIYEFAANNIGVVKYLLLSQKEGEEFFHLFFQDKDFTDIVFRKMEELTGISDPSVIQAKYLILFNSFLFPLFYQVWLQQERLTKLFLYNSGMRQAYLNEMLKLLKQ